MVLSHCEMQSIKVAVKKMNIYKVKVHNNNVLDQKKVQVDLSGAIITWIMELHQVIGNVFVESC